MDFHDFFNTEHEKPSFSELFQNQAMDDEKLLHDQGKVSDSINSSATMPAVASISSRSVPKQSQAYKVYKRRWYMLSVLALLNLSNAVVSNFQPLTLIAN